MAVYDVFCDTVLRHIPRATPKEQEEIRMELCSHLEDHRDMLIDRGIDSQEAEKRAVEAMGPAEEIGAAWNKQLSPFWLWLGNLCKTLFIVLLFVMILPMAYQLSPLHYALDNDILMMNLTCNGENGEGGGGGSGMGYPMIVKNTGGAFSEVSVHVSTIML